MAKTSVKEALATQADELAKEYGDKTKAVARRAAEKAKQLAGTRLGRAGVAVTVAAIVAGINRKTVIRWGAVEVPWGLAIGAAGHVIDSMKAGGGDADLRAASDAALAAGTALLVDRRAALMGW